MNIKIRQENQSDHNEVNQLIESAFKAVVYSDQTEHLLVKSLRLSDSFIPELSLVACVEEEIVGHILLTKIKINNTNTSFDSLALAPVSAKPIFQNKGIGGQLIEASHEIAKALGHHSIILVGHEGYYPRFGYKLLNNYKIQLPFEAPDKNCMVIELVKNGLQYISGVVKYDPAFGIS